MPLSTYCIFIIGDDATTNLLSGFVLKRFFANPDVHFFSTADSALNGISDVGETAPPTLIFIDAATNAASCRTFLKKFSQLDNKIQSRYALFMSIAPNDSEHFNIAQLYPAVGIVPRPISQPALNAIGTKALFRRLPKPVMPHPSPNQMQHFEWLKNYEY